MITEEKTVTEILAELKTIDKRINKLIQQATFVAVLNPKTSTKTVKDVETDILSGYQKATDLIERRNAMKAALVLSNATNKVVVNGKEYTIAEAIDAKSHAMQYKSQMLSAMANQAQAANREYNRMTADVEQKASTLAAQIAGTSSTDRNSEVFISAYEEYKKANPIYLVNPLSLETKIQDMADELDAFALNVDTALSVANAKTVVTFSYGAAETKGDTAPCTETGSEV